jgi:hypothetical protein
MSSPAREHELRNFLAALPPEKATRLAIAVERSRLTGERSLPSGLILDGLRPTLRQFAPRRTPTAQRLFCEPFSDFLVDERDFKQPGRISRSTIAALWQWLAREGLRERLAQREAAIVAAILARDATEEEQQVRQLQQEAAGALAAAFNRAMSGGPEQRSLASRFGGDDALADAQEIALLLSGASELMPLRGLLPRRIDMLSEQNQALVRDLYEELAIRKPELCPYVGLLVLSRLRRPWEVLRLAAIRSSKGDEPLFRQQDMAIIGDILLADMEHMALDIASVRPDAMDTDAILNRLDRFTQMSSGLVREIGSRRDGKWGQRLIKIRQLASDAMDMLIARVPREIAAALPMQKAGGMVTRAPGRADLSREPELGRIERALAWGRLLAGATPYAGGGGFHKSHKQAFDEVSTYLMGYSESVVAALRTLDPARRPRAQTYLVHAQALSATILGHEEAEQMRRRAGTGLAE